MVGQVKKAVIKRMNRKKIRKVRVTMTKSHMKLLVRKLCHDRDVSLKERRTLTMVGCMFYCLKRFNDVSNWRVENIQKFSDGSLEILQCFCIFYPREKKFNGVHQSCQV